MKRPVLVRRLAEDHLAEAYRWHEAQVPGLGVDFLSRFEEVLSQITRFPESCPIVFLDYRRALFRRFPFGVFFVIEAETVVIAAVYHLARNPATARRELPP